MEHISEILALIDQIKETRSTLTMLNATKRDREGLLLEFMKANDIKTLNYEGWSVNCKESMSSLPISKEEKREHVRKFLVDNGLDDSNNIIDEILSFKKERIEKTRVALKKL